MRIDVYLVEKGFCESRSKAARLIGDGKILLDGKAVSKASLDVLDIEHTVEIVEEDKFVGRGGLKLEGALEHFGFDVAGKRCIDVGASTGGFTDCLLQHGAAHVCAVDSGRGQLHGKLISDIRVTSVEGFNARALDPESFGYFDMAVMDVSFISQTLLHAPVLSVLKEGAAFISLIKPQFEAGKSALGKGGIVKKASDREIAVRRVVESALLCGFSLRGIIRSPIDGGDGNREYIAFFEKGGMSSTDRNVINYKQICKD
ncbi:MAG: TlyA family RNA methyltransferase [Ruminococcaceae bacterium]|nr:TlyA family RNA methyltransferase [Oscillospiraceae bacterium]